MFKPIFRFVALLTLLLSVLFAIHLSLLNYSSLPLFENKIVPSYLINYFLATFIFIVLIALKDKFAQTLGFIFFGGSFLKFIVFFIFIYPSFKADGDVSRLEFASFFIPYAVALILEVIFVIKILNK